MWDMAKATEFVLNHNEDEECERPYKYKDGVKKRILTSHDYVDESSDLTWSQILII